MTHKALARAIANIAVFPEFSGSSLVDPDVEVHAMEQRALHLQPLDQDKKQATASMSPRPATPARSSARAKAASIVAGRDVTITGSDVLSNTGTLISGENVTIQHAENTLDVKQGQYAKQGGINVSLKGGVVDTAMAVYGAAKRADEVEDDCLKGLYAAKTAQTLFSGGAGSGINQLGDAGQQLKDLGEAIQTKGQSAKNASGGISLRIGIGGSSSQSETTSHETSAHGSTIRSNGDVAIVAREGDLTVTGSRVEGENVGLAAKHDIVLQSAEEAAQQKERSKAASGEIGITVGTEAGIGVSRAEVLELSCQEGWECQG